ncbi:hypothetical protein C0Q70_11987 [Pomacea canaliculata]|uniref:Methyltransferase FkbM domain-containing protein n=1 Tax=Pomacea canaliculata TaxID=400727 RepID=A0A2T7P096_POMCA|nr:uncharacterized protein LOC112568416 [Pomacea canaliculata]PVD26840.1 hypothetical protein C0Q70_11987 [Pomacea canaliculata]
MPHPLKIMRNKRFVRLVIAFVCVAAIIALYRSVSHFKCCDLKDSDSTGRHVAMETETGTGVRIYRADNYNCSHLLPFRLFDGKLSQICTYDPDVDYISAMIKKWQGFQSKLIRDITLALRYAQESDVNEINTNVTFVDLGSNIGVFTLTAAMAGYEVLAVDALRETLQLMVTSLHLAGVTSRVTVLNNAISDVREVVSMEIDRSNMGGSKVKQDSWVNQNSSDDDNVNSINMNDLIPYVRSRRAVVKMDIEGFEERALWSASEFFEKIDVYSVLMEWSFHRGDSGPPIIRFMSRRGMLPYSDTNKSEALDPVSYKTWPDDVVFIR